MSPASTGFQVPAVTVSSSLPKRKADDSVLIVAVISGPDEDAKATVVGNPFLEKQLMEACLELFKGDAVVAMQDLGAAGLTSSVVECASRGGVGVEIDVQRVPRRETGMTAYEVMLSESQDIIGSVSVGAGHVASTSDNLNVFDHFFLGQDVIRGFDSRGFGPRLQNGPGGTYADAAGGTTYFNGSLEVSAPLPMISRDFGLRMNVFADAGTLYGNDLSAASLNCHSGASGSCVTQNVVGADMEWRASVGVGLTWASPFGPLRIYYAEPVVKESYDETKKIGFGASTRF